MERKTAATMIAERYGCNCHEMYKSRRMVDPECTLHSEGEEIEELMTKYADQEKEAEACEFAEFVANAGYVKDDVTNVWYEDVACGVTEHSISDIYQQFLIFKSNGGK